MKAKEFKQWLAYHVARFPSLDNWFRNREESGLTSIKDILDAWRTILADVRFDDAVRATDTLFEQQEDVRPDSLPHRIVALAKQQKGKLISDRLKPIIRDGEEFVTCEQCRDSGWVKIWHPETIKAIRNGKPVIRYTALVVCNCERGEDRRTVTDLPTPVYRADRMFAVAVYPTIDDLIAAIKRTEVPT